MSKVFYCPYCEKNTRHIEKSSQEVYVNDGKKWELFGKVMDITGTTTICNYALNQFNWRCLNCGLGTIRKYDGEIIAKTWNL